MQPTEATLGHASLFAITPDEIAGSGQAVPESAHRTGPTVHFVGQQLLDHAGDELTYGGAQRWMLALAQLVHARGHAVVIHQGADRRFRRYLAGGIRIDGHACPRHPAAAPLLNHSAHRAIARADPVVYLSEELAFPHCRPRSVFVARQLRWDNEQAWVQSQLSARLARRAVERCAAVVCSSTHFMNGYRTRWPDSDADHKLHHVPSFIAPDDWGPPPARPAATVETDGEIEICIPRANEPRRGLRIVTEVIPRLADRFPHLRFRFVVGSGADSESLRQQLASSGVGLHRWRIEALSFAQMRDAYEQAAIAVLPSVCSEGAPLVALEAMYFGCAVVGTWVGGLPELIRDGQTGLLAAPTANDIEAALTQLITDREMRSRLGRSAMCEVAARYGIEPWRARVGAVLERALGIRPN